MKEINDLISGVLNDNDEQAIELELSQLIDQNSEILELPEIPNEEPATG